MSMNSDLDVPDLPFKKPEALEKLELLQKDQRNAMDPYERESRIQEAAASIAEKYHQKDKEDFKGCVLLVETALREMGASMGGEFGTHMVGLSLHAAEEACKRVYEIPDFEME